MMYDVRTYRSKPFYFYIVGPAPTCPAFHVHPWVKVVRTDVCLLLFLVTDAKNKEQTRPAHGGGQGGQLDEQGAAAAQIEVCMDELQSEEASGAAFRTDTHVEDAELEK
jgi:hypothetical protein